MKQQAVMSGYIEVRAPSQYTKRRLSVRSRKVSKPRDYMLQWSYRSEIWQAPRQQSCRCACQNSKRYDNLKYQSRGFETLRYLTLRYLTERRLFGYWDGAQISTQCRISVQINWVVTNRWIAARRIVQTVSEIGHRCSCIVKNLTP